MTFVKTHTQREQDSTTNAAVTAIAVASKTPFKTAFKVTMGIALAQLAVGGLVILGIAVTIGTITFLVRR